MVFCGYRDALSNTVGSHCPGGCAHSGLRRRRSRMRSQYPALRIDLLAPPISPSWVWAPQTMNPETPNKVLQGKDLNLRPLGYEGNRLGDSATHTHKKDNELEFHRSRLTGSQSLPVALSIRTKHGQGRGEACGLPSVGRGVKLGRNDSTNIPGCVEHLATNPSPLSWD
jgi:hypothetical protein